MNESKSKPDLSIEDIERKLVVIILSMAGASDADLYDRAATFFRDEVADQAVIRYAAHVITSNVLSTIQGGTLA